MWTMQEETNENNVIDHKLKHNFELIALENKAME